MIADLRGHIHRTFRQMAKEPVFFATVLVTLALGIGANAAAFAAINTVLLRPLPFPQPDRLFLLRGHSTTTSSQVSYSYPDFVDLRTHSRSFSAMAAWRDQGRTLSGFGDPEFIDTRQVSAGLFGALGAPLAHGREFLPEDDQLNGEPVALIDHGMWHGRFGGKRDAIGSSIVLDGKPHTIVGVLSEGVQLFGRPSVYTPLGQYDDASMRGRRFRPGLWAVGRLQEGISPASARSELTALGTSLAEQFPDTNTGRGFTAVPLRDTIVGDTRQTLILFAAAAALVLLVACANVTNLSLARSVARAHEFTVRSALGATWPQILTQLVAESVVIAGTAGVAGMATAVMAVGVISQIVGVQAPALPPLVIDWRVSLFAAMTSIVTACLLGLPAAIRQYDARQWMLTQSTRGAAPAFRRIQTGLVVTQVGLTFVLLAGAGVMLRTIASLRDVDMGFDASNVLTAGIGLSPTVLSSSTRIRESWEDALARTAAIPGVQAAALNISLPLQGEESIQYAVDGTTVRSARVGAPSLDYWAAMRIPLVRGRYFDERDAAGAAMVVIVDEQLAANAFPGQDPLGESIMLRIGQPTPARTVGVVRHIRYSRLDEDAIGVTNEQLYLPFAQLPNAFLRPLSGGMRLVLRSAENPSSLERSLRQAVMGSNRDQPTTCRPCARWSTIR